MQQGLEGVHIIRSDPDPPGLMNTLTAGSITVGRAFAGHKAYEGLKKQWESSLGVGVVQNVARSARSGKRTC